MNFTVVFFIQIIVTVLFCVLAAIYDVKYNIVPDRLNFSLMVFGLASNLILTIITANVKFILASIISLVVIYYVMDMLWKLNLWGGGDSKLFISIATVIPIGLNVDFLNIFPTLSVYPFVFTVIINSILVSFPFLMSFTVYLIIKSNLVRSNVDLAFNMLNLQSLKLLINTALNKTVKVSDLKEGMIVNDYFFSQEHVKNLIDEMDSNLKVYRSHDDNYDYYFKSQTAGGITKDDLTLLKVMCAQKFISDTMSVKITFPFTPAILFGLVIALIYGDLVMITVKNFALVI